MKNERELDNVLLELGHDDFNLGTKYIREAVRLWNTFGRVQLTKELYPLIAKNNNSTPQRVERCMRHSIEKAWRRGSEEARRFIFGYSYSPESGRPTVGEYVAGLARYCDTWGKWAHEN